MGLADARAMYPKLPVVEADPEADRRLLEGIADWCDRYTPLIGLDPPDGLLLDVTGCAHLFGGEAALARDLVARLAQQGLRARVAVADTAGCAWGVARYGKQGIVPAGETQAAMLEFADRGAARRCRDRCGPEDIRSDLRCRSRCRARARRSPRASARNCCFVSIRRWVISTSRSRRACRCRRRWPNSVSPIRSRARPMCSARSRSWRASWSPCWIGAARAGVCFRWRCFAPTARCIVSSSAPARRCAIRRACGSCSRSGSPCWATPAIPASATTWSGFRRWSPSAAIRCRADLAAPDHGEELAHLIDRLGARFGLRRVTRHGAAGHAHSGVCGGGGAGACGEADGVCPFRIVEQDSSRCPSARSGCSSGRSPSMSIAEVPDGPPVAVSLAARSMHHVVACRRAGAHRNGMVARRSRQQAHA